MHPKNLSINDYTYQLPDDRIARFPLPERDQSKLLIYKNGQITEDVYRNIASHLPEGALLVFNNTRVIEARLFFQKPTGGIIEIFALEPHEQYINITAAMEEQGRVWWKCLIGGAGKWKHGQVLEKEITYGEETIKLAAKIIGRLPDSFTIEFNWQPVTLPFVEVLHAFGVIPIPPYLKRETEAGDQHRYQTIYAEKNGSVAAPTAGLHFTEGIFQSLPERQIRRDFVTLHVGAGTFMPVKSSLMENHNMHAEYIEFDTCFVERLIQQKTNIFAVGTTSLRTLESIYWMGVKCCADPAIKPHQLGLQQWEVYDSLESLQLETEKALAALVSWMKLNLLPRLIIKTQIIIAPGYKSRLVRGLVTNFHQPHSTLLLLVAAMAGENWKSMYAYALNHNFRFLSYGDGSLIYID